MYNGLYQLVYLEALDRKARRLYSVCLPNQRLPDEHTFAVAVLTPTWFREISDPPHRIDRVVGLEPLVFCMAISTFIVPIPHSTCASARSLCYSVVKCALWKQVDLWQKRVLWSPRSPDLTPCDFFFVRTYEEVSVRDPREYSGRTNCTCECCGWKIPQNLAF